MMKDWAEIWYYIFIPIIVAGVVVGITSKRLFTGLLGGLFFIFWGIVIPLLMVTVFSVFGLFEPALIDAILIPIVQEPMSSWNYDIFFDLTNSYFLSWIFAGVIEMGGVVMLFSLIISQLIQSLK